MPLFDQAAIQEMAQRQLRNEQPAMYAPAPERVQPSTTINGKSLSPLEAVLAGSAIDSASTYKFLKGGTGSEGNAMWQGMSPLATGAAVGLAGPALHYALKKISPRLANMVGSQLGARQMALGGENFKNSRSELSSEDRVTQKLGAASGISSNMNTRGRR